MAGSRRSPVLRDQWRGPSDTGDQRGRERQRPRGAHRDRGRDRFRDRDRRRRPKDARPDRSSRSPPPRSFPQSGHNPHHRDFSPGHAAARDSPGLSYSDIHPNQTLNRPHSPPPPDFLGPEPPHQRNPERDHRRDDSPSAPPPSKRKRTRSPSPGGYPSNPSQHNRPPLSRQGDEFDRSLPPNKRRGRQAGRGRPGRRSPRRGRDRRKNDSRRNRSRPRPSRSPGWGGKPYPPRRRLDSPHPEREFEEGSRYRSVSRHSIDSLNSRFSSISHTRPRGDPALMPGSRPTHSKADNPLRSPSPRQPPGLDADNASISMDLGPSKIHESRPFDSRDTQRPRPQQLHDASPQYVTPTNSYHGSPQPTSPYSAGRGGGRGGQLPPFHSEPGQNDFQGDEFQGQYHQKKGPYNVPPSHDSSHSYRGGRSAYRGGYQGHGGDRRFSGSGPSSHSRGHFNNLQWNASDSRMRMGPSSHSPPPGRSSETPPPPPPPGDLQPPGDYEDNDGFRPPSKDSRVTHEGSKPGSDHEDSQNFPPTTRPPDISATPNKGGKISFAFKAKTATTPAPKLVPDLAQRMLARDPPPRVAEPPRNRMSTGPPAKFKPDTRFDRRDRDRERQRDRDRNKGRNDRRDFRDSRGYREPRDGRENRREDRRFDTRHDRKRGERPQDFRPERRRERSPETNKQPKTLLRAKPRPTIPDEFAHSDSVYYRKPGNESVIGAGTYGKVFKAIHVYTQRKVALKKIRMEGEKDGFPVTAVREIKLLQHLRNHNVVSLLEVMVEKNECFMVFEYLSHDLTGLINHPTFTLTAAHKKDLAKQMFEGLNYLHHRSVLHRDIKAANILISNRGQLKFADFGLARFFSKSRQLDYTNRVITIWYRPPELLLGETRYGPAVDVWSAACVYVEMFTKKAVFPGEGGEISQLDKLYNSLGTPTRAEWPDIIEMPWFELMRPTERRKRIFEDVYRDTLSPAALDLISQIFRYDPTKRPTAEEVLAHPYFTSEEPTPQQPIELENIEGDWHEFESKALRKERDKEARRAEYQRDKEKRKAAPPYQNEQEPKRLKAEGTDNATPSGQLQVQL